MNKILSVVLCAVLCVVLAGAVVTVVIAAVQVASYIGLELSSSWAAAVAVILPLISMIALGIWLLVTMIMNLSAGGRRPRG